MAQQTQNYQVQTETGVVTIQLVPPADDVEKREQLFEVGALFFVAVLTVFLAKQLLNLFLVEPND